MLSLLALAALASAQSADERILGVYMFHRHGDRTPKALAPTNLTSLGYNQVYSSGEYFRSRYISSASSSFSSSSNNSTLITSISPTIVSYQQLVASAPSDTVLHNSAQGFLQGLYPPVGSSLGTETLRNGSEIEAPMNGYQLIPISTPSGFGSAGAGSEDAGWLQSTSNCAQARISSNEYFSSEEYEALLEETREFYEGLREAVEEVVGEGNVESEIGELSFKNAYTIYDLLSLSLEQNTTLSNTSIISSTLDTSTLEQLSSLANVHEWNLAYNTSSPIRAVSGSILASQALSFLQSTISSQGKKNLLGIQFGAYATFASFFGLAQLENVNEEFKGVVDFASAMVWEMVTNSSSSEDAFPSEDDIFLRFRFHNGTTTSDDELLTYPLFGSGEDVLPWNDFVEEMQKISIGSTEQWCTACGNFTGECAAYGDDSQGSASAAGKGSGSGNGLGPTVNGVIGAMVTLAVVLGLEALVLALGGLRVVKKRGAAQEKVEEEVSEGEKA
ncbi:hypothetical protein CBER1_08802 [Cercospora berteroae]|uniref:Acid phosphatase n=1 Tax=Cercospora berteroae TaxID=357750 RepID=A0A2S6BWR4_9PEZI|nr:hypothetical protein CBER1_08802 [Cercospora berteroae]